MWRSKLDKSINKKTLEEFEKIRTEYNEAVNNLRDEYKEKFDKVLKGVDDDDSRKNAD